MCFFPDSCAGCFASVQSKIGENDRRFSGAPMALVDARSEAPIDFDSIFASLKQHCPGTELLDDDYGASRIARLVEMSRALGKSEYDPVISRALETTRKLGQTRRIRVPLADGSELVGTVSQGVLLLVSKEPVPSETLAPVLAALRTFAQLHVKVSLESEPKKFELYVKVGLEMEPAKIEAVRSQSPYSPRAKRPWWKFWG
jgi:hypothetical protein